jgi:thymidylate synthase (FAD)
MRHRGIWGISYAQESTRYVNYSNKKFDGDLMISLPSKFYEIKETLLQSGTCPKSAEVWNNNEWIEYLEKNCDEWIEYEKPLRQSEESYMKLSEYGWKPQDARGVLNLDVKTEFLMCAYKQDWKMWLFRRLDGHAHPHIQWFAHKVKDFFDKFNKINI